MWNNLISFAIGNQSIARRAKRALDDVYDIHQNDDFPPDIKDLLAYAAMINILVVSQSLTGFEKPCNGAESRRSPGDKIAAPA